MAIRRHASAARLVPAKLLYEISQSWTASGKELCFTETESEDDDNALNYREIMVCEECTSNIRISKMHAEIWKFKMQEIECCKWPNHKWSLLVVITK